MTLLFANTNSITTYISDSINFEHHYLGSKYKPSRQTIFFKVSQFNGTRNIKVIIISKFNMQFMLFIA